MSIISIEFFIMVALATIIYWITPSKCRWIVLLLSSMVFMYFVNEANIISILLMLGMIGIAYFSAIIFEKSVNALFRRIIVFVSVFLEIGLLIRFKESIFFLKWFHLDLNDILPMAIIAPFGISYFTLTLVGYILDTYWKVQKVEKNPFKFLLFSTYFPLLTSGPIVKYSETGEELTKPHKFSYKDFAFGCQRILWGIFKKLVISERLSIIVNAIYDDPQGHPGLYIWLAVIFFVIQLYTDFSGCLDIIYGVSDIFQIQLPENFDHPFAATNLSEFWRKWHITLGNWLKEYVFYPIMKSSIMISVSAFLKKKFGKKNGKKVTSCIGLFFSWFLIGFWHGGTMNYIIGVGLWMWFVIAISELLSPSLDKIASFLEIKRDCYSWGLFQKIRTFILFAFGLGLFPATSFLKGVEVYSSGFSVFNPWIFFDGSLLQLGLTSIDYNILFFAIILLIIAGEISLRNSISLREWVYKQNVAFRWIIWISIFSITLIYGMYGPGYSAAEFIYKGF